MYRLVVPFLAVLALPFLSGCNIAQAREDLLKVDQHLESVTARLEALEANPLAEPVKTAVADLRSAVASIGASAVTIAEEVQKAEDVPGAIVTGGEIGGAIVGGPLGQSIETVALLIATLLGWKGLKNGTSVVVHKVAEVAKNGGSA